MNSRPETPTARSRFDIRRRYSTSQDARHDRNPLSSDLTTNRPAKPPVHIRNRQTPPPAELERRTPPERISGRRSSPDARVRRRPLLATPSTNAAEAPRDTTRRTIRTTPTSETARRRPIMNVQPAANGPSRRPDSSRFATTDPPSRGVRPVFGGFSRPGFDRRSLT